MTVTELIAELQKLPDQTAEVEVRNEPTRTWRPPTVGSITDATSGPNMVYII